MEWDKSELARSRVHNADLGFLEHGKLQGRTNDCFSRLSLARLDNVVATRDDPRFRLSRV